MNAASAPRSLGPTASTRPVQNRSSAAVAGHEPPSSAIVATIVESHLIAETSGSQHGDAGKTAAGARGPPSGAPPAARNHHRSDGSSGLFGAWGGGARPLTRHAQSS